MTTKKKTAASIDLPALARIVAGLGCAYGADRSGTCKAAGVIYRSLAKQYQGDRFQAATRIAADAANIVGGDPEAILAHTRETLAAVVELATAG